MATSFLGQKRLRKYYGKIREILEMPNLIEVQKSSYELFLKSGDQSGGLAGVASGDGSKLDPVTDLKCCKFVDVHTHALNARLALLVIPNRAPIRRMAFFALASG